MTANLNLKVRSQRMFFFLCCSNFFLHFLFFIFSFYCIHVSLRFSFVFLDGEVSNYISCRIFTSSPDCTFMFTAVIHIKKISINAVSHTKKKERKGTVRIKFHFATICNPTLSSPQNGSFAHSLFIRTKPCSPKPESCSILSVQSSLP